MLEAVEAIRSRGARVVVGGERLQDEGHRKGYYMAPTVVENVPADDDFSCRELFGPITALYRARDFEHALELANLSPYGLTASVHTRSLHRALEFTRKVEAGVVSINAGTFGSEPHMPFGGVKSSGNGTREPGTEALDVYSNLKDVYMSFDPAQV
jgi:aldehyde dehydrogenase (NAD+)